MYIAMNIPFSYDITMTDDPLTALDKTYSEQKDHDYAGNVDTNYGVCCV